MNAIEEALRAYMRTIAYLQRTTNPEEWESHGDWATLERNAKAALGD